MTDAQLLTAEDLPLMQRLAQRVTALRPDLLGVDASYGELAWVIGKDLALHGHAWPRRIWTSGGEPLAWAWASLPRTVRRGDGSTTEITGASLAFQVHPEHPELTDEVVAWYEETTAGLDRTAVPTDTDTHAVERFTARGYRPDVQSLADDGDWTQLNRRALDTVAAPRLPDGYRFRTAEEAGPEAAVRAHTDAWERSTYSARSYAGVRATDAYRGDLHLLVEAPDGTMAASTIMWLDPANRTVEFEPVGTHPDHRRRGLARAMMLHGMHLARAAGAEHATVVCLGAPAHPAARAVYHGLGFREISRDAPLIKRADAHA